MNHKFAGIKRRSKSKIELFPIKEKDQQIPISAGKTNNNNNFNQNHKEENRRLKTNTFAENYKTKNSLKDNNLQINNLIDGVSIDNNSKFKDNSSLKSKILSENLNNTEKKPEASSRFPKRNTMMNDFHFNLKKNRMSFIQM